MAQPSPSQIIANIKRAVEDGHLPQASEHQSESPAPALDSTGYPAPDNPRALFEVLERGPFPEMRRREAVDQLSGTGLAGVFKRLIGRILRMVSGPQAAFNRKTIEAAEITAGEVDSLRQRIYWDVRGVHERLTAIDQQNQQLVLRNDALEKQVETLQQLVDRLGQDVATKAPQEDLAKLWDEVPGIHAAIAERASQSDVSKLWDEVAQLYKAIDARAGHHDIELLWSEIPKLVQAISERAAQEDLSKLWDEHTSLSTAVSERASQADMTKVWEEIPKLVAAIDGRASQVDMTKVWEEIPRLIAAIEARASHADVSKLWQEIGNLVAAVSERASQADMTKLWEEIPNLLKAINERVVYADLDALRKEMAKISSDFEPVWLQIQSLNQSIDDQVAGVWRGLSQRDSQHQLDFAAIKRLEQASASAETELREIRARLLTLREQLNMAEERIAAGPSTPQSASVPPASQTVAIEQPMTTLRGASADVQRKLDLAYLEFQRRFRGDEAELAERLGCYVPVLTEATGLAKPRVLDVACGDGIFLARLAREGWPVVGVDSNGPMVRIATERGVEVTKSDALEYLDALDAGTQDVVTALQFVEHLPPDVLFRFVAASLRVLKPGGVLLVETINPHTLKALHWFHLDLSHARLIYPEMLGLLCESAGFSEVTWKGINPVAEHERLQVLAESIESPNIERLNRVLFGEQDYYLIARKSSR
ncbi:methyltransferase domain-containing protein [bacterium]|nr:methyltransferase domain-containing protein [bacterium]